MGRPPAHADGRPVFLVDEWPAFRRSLRLFLEAAGYRVVGEAKTVRTAAEVPALAIADRVILDPGRMSIDIVADVATLRSMPAIVLLTPERLPQDVASEALLAGANVAGANVHLTKFASPADLLGALAIALSGDLVVLPRSYPVSASRPSRPSRTTPLLTRREQEILSLVASGHTDRAISEILWVAEQTVKFYMATVFRKLEVSSRAEAVEQARRLGLIGE